MSFTAALFPGQGAQIVGMGKDVAQRFPVAEDTFARADEVLGFGLSRFCFEGPAERLNETDTQQPAIFVTSVAMYRAARECGLVSDDMFPAMGGLSLGEYTALHLSGALSFDDAVRLVHERGRLMQRAADSKAGGMVSIMGLDEAKTLALCESVRADGLVGPSNFNCPGQIVISGDRAACQAAAAAAESFGGRAIPLDVAGAFHSELMRSAADGLRPVLEACDIQPPRVRVIANVDAGYHTDAASIRDSLYRQVFNPVRWQACVERLITDGCSACWEFGPKRVLAGMMRRIDRSVKVRNVATAADLEKEA